MANPKSNPLSDLKVRLALRASYINSTRRLLVGVDPGVVKIVTDLIGDLYDMLTETQDELELSRLETLKSYDKAIDALYRLKIPAPPRRPF